VQSAAAGVVCGNTISVDAPLASFGKPIQGTTLYNVTGLTFGRNGTATDIYSDVDAAPSFDYTLGSVTAGVC
jgi:hypothetical protein